MKARIIYSMIIIVIYHSMIYQRCTNRRVPSVLMFIKPFLIFVTYWSLHHIPSVFIMHMLVLHNHQSNYHDKYYDNLYNNFGRIPLYIPTCNYLDIRQHNLQHNFQNNYNRYIQLVRLRI